MIPKAAIRIGSPPVNASRVGPDRVTREGSGPLSLGTLVLPCVRVGWVPFVLVLVDVVCVLVTDVTVCVVGLVLVVGA